MANQTGKTALITGASVGIGRDLAELFAEAGHHLVITARNQEQLEQIATKLRSQHSINVEVIPKDLSLPNAAQEIFDSLQAKGIAIEYLVNNAGFGTHGPFAESNVAGQLAMVQVNIAALTHLTRLFLPPMLAAKSGRILNVGSVAGFLPGPLMAVYFATKAFVMSFSVALAGEVEGSGVTVTDLCPGSTATEFQKRAGIAHSDMPGRPIMDSLTVARVGYDAMMRGRLIAIPGSANKLMAFGTRLTPLRILAKIAHKLNRDR